MKHYAVLIIVAVFVCIETLCFAQTKNETRIDTMKIVDYFPTCCYQLDPDSIKHYKGNSDYFGKVILSANIDTINLNFNNFKVIFAKLKSRTNMTDTIEMRTDSKIGNYKFINSLLPSLIRHLDYIKLKKINEQDCIKPCIYYFPITID